MSTFNRTSEGLQQTVRGSFVLYSSSKIDRSEEVYTRK